ncbi:MAG: indolepyruvate oxidoreductase subunit beta family protein [Gammaproteobacteria bacterium]
MNSDLEPSRPLCLLIAALGGEGGGVLTDWIVQAATAQGFPVQSTSIPGVAQRTGATTYYIEIFPTPAARLGGKAPILAIYPSPGEIDIMVASELLEVGRAIENGYVSPDRTLLIGSTHRIYAIAERAAMADNRYDADAIHKAAQTLAKRLVLADLEQLTEQNATALNAVLAGVIAGTERLPMPVGAFEAAITASGIAVESNLRGFQTGLALARGETRVKPATPLPRSQARREAELEAVLEQVYRQFPPLTHAIVGEGVKRVCDFQDAAYARMYVERLARILEHDDINEHFALTRETGRYLALWMSYEDVIRVADLKTRPGRYQRVRQEVRAKPDEPVHVSEFFKPGVDEIASILPVALGRRLRAWAVRRGSGKPFHISMRVKSHTIVGFLQLWLIARLRPWRRRSLRFEEEQRLIERWLGTIGKAMARDYALALEIAECANLNKGYGETFSRGRGNFLRIFEQIIEPALRGEWDDAAARVRAARTAALTDPEGIHLEKTLRTATAQPVRWYSAKNDEKSADNI